MLRCSTTYWWGGNKHEVKLSADMHPRIFLMGSEWQAARHWQLTFQSELPLFTIRGFVTSCKSAKSILALKSSASSSDLTFLLKQVVWSLVPISTHAEASVDGHDQYSWQHLFSFGREDHGGSRRDEILSHHWVMWLSNHLRLQNPSRPCIWTQIQVLRMTSVLQRFVGSGPCFHTSSFHGCLEPRAQKTAVKRSLSSGLH